MVAFYEFLLRQLRAGLWGSLCANVATTIATKTRPAGSDGAVASNEDVLGRVGHCSSEANNASKKNVEGLHLILMEMRLI